MIYFPEVGSNATSKTLLIPVSDLPMIEAPELGSDQGIDLRIGKILLAIGTALQEYTAANNPLGFTVTKTRATFSADRDNVQFNLSVNRIASMIENSFEPYPVPSEGANTGIGGFTLQDIFPNAFIINSGNLVESLGVGIEQDHLQALDPSFNFSYSDDARAFFELFFANIPFMGENDSPNGVIVATANPTNYTTTPLPVAAIADVDPTTDIGVQYQLGTYATMAKTLSYTLRTELTNDGRYDVVIL
jgi:hypothetical protein